jgi:hypothetical protein
MINVSISYGFGKEDRYYKENIPSSIQLALYKYKLQKNATYLESLVNKR